MPRYQIYLLLIVCLTAQSLSAQTWLPLGPEGYNNPSLDASNNTGFAVASNGHLFVAYSDETFAGPGYPIIVREFDGNTWTPAGSLGSISGSGSLPLVSLALEGTTPYVAYRDRTLANKATVKKYDGTAWVNVGAPGFSSGSVGSLSLAFDGGTPYLAYAQGSIGNKAVVKKFDGTNWVTVGTLGFSPGAATYLNLSISGGTPYVAYADAANGSKAAVKKFDGANWVDVGAPAVSTGIAQYLSLALDGGVPYLAYQDWGNTYHSATLKKFDGINWVTVGNPEISDGNSNAISLAVYSGTPYVAYQDYGNLGITGGRATVKKYDGANWTPVGPVGFTPSTVDFLTLAFNGSTPCLAYQNGFTQVAQWNGTGWESTGEGGISSGLGLGSTSLAFSGATPFIAISDEAFQGKARVRKWTGSGWVDVGQPGFSARYAAYLSLAFAGTDPIVAYVDGDQSDKATVSIFDGTNWTLVGAPGFSADRIEYLSLAVDGATPYVAYQDYGNGRKVTVKKYDGASWTDVGTPGFSAGIASDVSLALLGNTPYVGYTDAANGNKASVKKFDGTAWVDLGPAGGFSAGAAAAVSLAISGGVPYIAYADGPNGNKATVKKYDGAAWTDVGAPGFSAGEAFGCSLTFAGTTPCVAYADEASGYKLTVKRLNGATWENVGAPGLSAGISYSISLKASGNTLFVGYSNGFALAKKFDCATQAAVSITGAGSVCPGQSITLTASGGIGYSWSTTESAAAISVTPATTTTYTVTATDGDGCTGTAVATVTVSSPTADAIANQSVCNGSFSAPVHFTGTPADAFFTWTNDNPAIGLGAGGSGNIPAFQAVNTGNTPAVATVTVTPATGGFAYVPNAGSNDVSVINTVTNTVVETIPVNNFPLGVTLSPDGSRAYVTHYQFSGLLSVINTATNTVVTTVAVGSNPLGVCVSPDGRLVYVANSASPFISVIDAATNTVSATIPLNNAPLSIAVSPDGGKLYVIYSIADYFTVVNTTTNTVESTFAVAHNPNDLCVSPDGNRVYMINSILNTVSVINTANNMITATIPVGNYPYSIGVSPDGSRVYVTNVSSNTVSVINTATEAVVATVGVGASPYGISVSPDGRQVYATNPFFNSVSVINTATNMMVETISVGSSPYSLGNFVGGACTGAPVSFTITVNPDPAALISGTTTLCPGISTTLTASGGIGYHWSTNENTAAIQVNSAGTYTVTVTDANGCTATAEAAITVYPASTAVISGTTTICPGGNTTLTASGGIGYHWSTNENTAAISANSIGTYTVTVTDANGCTATAEATITANPAPTALISGTTAICPGGNTTLTASGGIGYHWSTNENTVAILANSAGTYTVTVTGANGCTATAEATITANPAPTAVISGTTTICPGGSTALTASGGISYHWSTDENTAAIVVSSVGTYTVTVTDAHGCMGTAEVSVLASAMVSAGISLDAVPYVAFQDAANGSRASVKKFDGSDWVNVGPPGFSTAPINLIELAMHDAMPYVAYGDFSIGSQLVVKKFDGLLWQDVGPVGSIGAVDYNLSLVFSGSTPYIAYQTAGLGGQKITVKKFDGSAWVTVGNPLFSAGAIYFCRLAFAGTIPYVAYQDLSNGGRITVMKFDGSAWIPVGNPGFSPGTALYCSLAIDGLTPYVAFRDGANGDGTTVMKYDGSAWVYVGAPGGSSGPAVEIELAISGSIPYVSYATFGNDGIKKFDGTAWVEVGNPGGAYGASELAFSGSTPYIVSDAVKKLDNGVWNFVGASNIGSLSNSSLALTDGGSQTICAGQSATFTASGGSGYDWSNGASTASITVMPAVTTTYTVTVTDANGCTGTAEATVTVNPAPVVMISGGDVLCPGESAILTASGGGDYGWSTNENTAAIMVNAAGTYTVTVTDANSCTATESKLVSLVSTVTVSGDLYTKNNDPIAGMYVELSGDATETFYPTGADGHYTFNAVPGCSDVTVTPNEYDLATTNCISVLDMEAMLKYLNGTMPLPSPYCLIAADVNQSGSINILDINHLKDNILGINAALTQNGNWTFVDANYVFPDPNNPFSNPWPESVSFTDLTADATADFIGVELGNIIGCPDPNAPAMFNLAVGDYSGAQNTTISVPVTVTNFNGVAGFQFSMGWNPFVVAFNGVSGFALPGLQNANFNLQSNWLSVAWLDGTLTGQSLPDGTVLFYLNFTLTGAPGSSSNLDFTMYPTVQEAVNPMCQSFGIGTTNGSLTILDCHVDITGDPIVCYGFVDMLSATPGFAHYLWSDGQTGASINTGNIYPPGPYLYTVTATDAQGCVAVASFTIAADQQMQAFTVSGGGAICPGGMANIYLSGSEPGITYQVTTMGNTPVGPSQTSTSGGSLTFQYAYASGTYKIWANKTTLPGPCARLMFGTATVSFLPLPTAFSVTGGGSYCAGGTGVPIGLSGSQTGVTYQMTVDGVPVGAPIPGGGAFILPNQTAPGLYNFVATINSSGCSQLMGHPKTITVNPLPLVFNVTGGGAYCSGGSGVPVGLSGSETGINYQLKRNGANVGAAVAGTGIAFSFGNFTATGTYTVVATASSGCTALMSGNAVVTVIPLPTLYNVTGGGSYCAGGLGVPIGLSGSQTGVTYQLYVTDAWGNTTPVGAPIPGGGAFVLPNQTAAGVYNFVATTNTGGCSRTMGHPKTITINPLPLVFNVTGGGSLCQGGAGVPIGLDNSQTGVSYRLRRNGVNIGAVVAGSTGNSISFGNFTTAGTYTVVATTAVGGCTVTMNGSAEVIVLLLPAPYPVVGGGTYCAGGIGVPVGLLNSQAGVIYELLRNGAPTGVTANGPGAVAFGLQTIAGVYTVRATTTAGGCSRMMSGSKTVGIIAVPTIAITAPAVICQGQTANLFASGGSSRVWSTGAVTAAITVQPAASTTYTVTVTNANGCTNSASAFIQVNQAPLGFNVTGGGTLCIGAGGVPIGLSNSETGVSYQLKNGASTVGAPLPGTGGALAFGVFSAAGAYTVVATNTTTGCSVLMNGSALVTVIPLPTAYPITGGGSYCAGGSGVLIGLSGSQFLVNYALYRNGAPTGITVVGQLSGGAISFGAQTAAGTYTVVATNAVNGCVRPMNGTATVTIKPLPAAAIAGPGSTCSGSPVTLTASGGGTYVWSTASTSATITKVPVGPSTTYTVTVTLSGCSSVTSTTVIVHPVPTLSITGTINDPNNPGKKIVTVAGSGGTPPYTFERCTPPTPGFGCVSGPGGVFTNVSPGTWLFKVTDANGCTGLFTAVVQPLQGPLPGDRAAELRDNRGTFDFMLAPNPAGGENTYLLFSGDFEKTNAVVLVYNSTGRLVLEQKAEIEPGDNTSLPVGELPAGLYRVLIRMENGEVKSRTLVIVRA